MLQNGPHVLSIQSNMKGYLLIGGLAMLLIHQCYPIPDRIQLIGFLAGIVTVGIPHGAADVLVSMKNAQESKRTQMFARFLLQYIGILLLFALALFYFPMPALIVFLGIAAFHFGETDLYQFDTNIISGKCFAFSYGLLIIGLILLTHLDEAWSLLHGLGVTRQDWPVLEWIHTHANALLSFLLVGFFVCTFIHFSFHPDEARHQETFLVQLVILFAVLYKLPLLLGFSFYFIIWHSLLSLGNIFTYLQKTNASDAKRIVRTIFLYSTITFLGIALFCIAARWLWNDDTLLVISFAALVVLTAPHMMVMHEMYGHLRRHLLHPKAATSI